jgi:hypothetical protein
MGAGAIAKISRVGQNSIYTHRVTVCLDISLLKLLYIHRVYIYIILADPNYLHIYASASAVPCPYYRLYRLAIFGILRTNKKGPNEITFIPLSIIEEIITLHLAKISYNSSACLKFLCRRD